MFQFQTGLPAAIFCFLCFVSSIGLAQKATDGESLEREVATLRKQLKETQRQLDKAIAAGFIYTEEGFSSALEILNTLPKELELNAKKPWDEVKWKDVPELLNQNTIGKPFRCKLVLSKVEIKQNPGHVNDRTQPKFEVTTQFQNDKFPKDGYVISQNVVRPYQGYQFLGDEELVEKAKKLKAGKSYEISGIIEQFEITRNSLNNHVIDVRVDLTRIDFEPLK